MRDYFFSDEMIYEKKNFLALKEAHFSILLSSILQLSNSGLKSRHLSFKENCNSQYLYKNVQFS